MLDARDKRLLAEGDVRSLRGEGKAALSSPFKGKATVSEASNLYLFIKSPDCNASQMKGEPQLFISDQGQSKI